MLGVGLVVVGLNYLFNPGVSSAYGSEQVVNLQRLTLGQTFTLAGAIFLAAAWRPR